MTKYHKNLNEHIDDKDMYKAVMFASSMIRKGKPPGLAFRIAANYYHVDSDDVARLVGQRGGRKRKAKR